MKWTATACIVLAGTLGFGSLAGARDQSLFERQLNGDQPGTGARHRGDRDWRHDAYRQESRRWDAPRHESRRHEARRYWRGGYLPSAYRQPHFYVQDWHGHGLYAPPVGHQWVQVGSDYLLIALATGLIANLLTQ